MLAEALAPLLQEWEASALLPPWILVATIWWIPPSMVRAVALLLNPPSWRLCLVFWVMSLPASRVKVLVVVMLLCQKKGRPLVVVTAADLIEV